MSVWRHKKRGTTYEILHYNAFLQCADRPDFEAAYENEHWIVYRSLQTGRVYLRMAREFLDGRFEELASDHGDAERWADELPVGKSDG